MEAFNDKLNTYIDSWMGPRDQRVRGMLLLDNYPITFALTVVYLLIVWMGPKYMKHRQPYSCRALLVFYNLGLTLLSFYMFYEIVTSVWHGGYNFICQNTHSAPEVDIKVINVLWWYYFSKLIEFMDTFFFILRKNNHQITFLHIYHHASMLNIWWFVMNWIPCGHSFFGASLNSFIHVVMYSYYGLSAIPAIRPYLWWKKYITQLQLIQFFLTVSHTMLAVIWPCGFPIGWLYFQISYMFTLIILFLNFYIQCVTLLWRNFASLLLMLMFNSLKLTATALSMHSSQSPDLNATEIWTLEAVLKATTYKKRSGSQRKHPQNGSPLSTNGHSNGMPSTDFTAPKKLRMD